MRINELNEAESERVLEKLIEHQLQPKYQYTHEWTEGDVLMWDHIGTLHNAVPDYTAGRAAASSCAARSWRIASSIRHLCAKYCRQGLPPETVRSSIVGFNRERNR